MSYLLIQNMRVQAANMHHSSFLVGGPPVMAAYLFGHAMGRELGFSVTGASLIHHQMTPLGQFAYGTFMPQQRRSASLTFTNKAGKDYSSKNKQALSLQPVATAHLRVSLVLEVDDTPSSDAVRGFLAGRAVTGFDPKCGKSSTGGRFSGGQIVGHGLVDSFEDVDAALKQVTSGFFVMDRKELLEPRDGKHQAELLIEHLGCYPDKVPGASWLSSACVGYAAITSFEARDGARSGCDHAYAEPLIGMVQYRSVRDAPKEIFDVFWSPQWVSVDVFRVHQSQSESRAV